MISRADIDDSRSKGGTCLKKFYIETYSFSEDLDFTVLEDGPIEQGEVLEAISRVLDRAVAFPGGWMPHDLPPLGHGLVVFP